MEVAVGEVYGPRWMEVCGDVVYRDYEMMDDVLWVTIWGMLRTCKKRRVLLGLFSAVGWDGCMGYFYTSLSRRRSGQWKVSWAGRDSRDLFPI